jgi:hypothetical protein
MLINSAFSHNFHGEILMCLCEPCGTFSSIYYRTLVYISITSRIFGSTWKAADLGFLPLKYDLVLYDVLK